LQRRGQETQERFAAAAAELLRAKTFEEISIQDIVRRAKRPIGSFYARFGGKEALLPFLYQRYHEDLESLFERGFGRAAREGLDFEASVQRVVHFFVDAYMERRGLIRALTLFARRRPEALPAGLLPQRRRIYALPTAILLRHRRRIAHADPEAAVAFGVFLVSCVARERVLFGDMPHARITAVSRAALRVELARALRSYLTCEVSS
jgi:AcrR family transcriptional regulator